MLPFLFSPQRRPIADPAQEFLRLMMTRTSLASGVHACRVGEAWVFLHTLQDRYFVLAGRQALWFSQIAQDGAPPALCAQAAALENRLCERGLLARQLHPGNVIAPAIETRNLAQLPAERGAPVRLRDAALFAFMFLTLCHLREPKRRNLPRILASVRRWKAAARARRGVRNKDAPSLTRSFRTLTPWFFSAHDACFFRSLLLVRFLCQYGIDPDWTFGVRVSPFRAHCWVSCDGYLLNEDLDVTAGYQPILTV